MRSSTPIAIARSAVHPFPRVLVLFLAAFALFPSEPARADHPALGLGSGIAGPVVTIPAYTLPSGMWGASLRLEYIDFAAYSDSELIRLAPNAGDVHSTSSVVSPSLSIAYGVTPNFTLGARLPFVSRRDIREGHVHEDLSAGVHDHGTVEGVGDLTLLAQIGIAKRGRSRLALLTGLKAPTGETHEESGGERLETDHQPGAGAWDFLEGIAWSSRTAFGTVDANILASFGAEGAQETSLGTIFQYNASLSWKVVGGAGAGHQHEDGKAAGRPHRHRGSVGADLILELNGEARSRIKRADVEEENSGGNLIYLSPGFRFGPPEGWSASASVGAPVLQDLNGTQHKTDLRILAGFSTSF